MLADGAAQPTQFELPTPSHVLDLTMSDGAIIRVRRHGNPDGHRIVFAHGNGFASDAYFPFWQRLLRDFDLIVYDQRNHGWNPRHHLAGHTQAQMADDMQMILDTVEGTFGKRRAAGVFHSLSTTVSLLHARKYGMRWDALVLLDPPLAPPSGHRLHEKAKAFEYALHDWALQRQNKFDDPSDLAAHFRNARRLRRWVPGAADLMARAITRRSSGGGYELACPPAFEAGIYVQNAHAEGWFVLPNCADRLLVIASDWNTADVDPPGLVSQAVADDLGLRVVAVPDTGHLLPIERPAEVEKALRNFLTSRGFGD